MTDFEITELNRRLANLIRIGTIAEADYDKALVRVQIGELKTGWLPWLTARAGGDHTWWAPEQGEQVMILSPGGDLAQGVVLAGLYQDAHPPAASAASKHVTTYKDGAVVEYDREAHHLKAILPGNATAELIATGGISIEGDISVTGNVTVSEAVDISGDLSVGGDTSVTGEVTAIGDVTGSLVSLSTHMHPTAPTGPTSPPIPG